MTTKTWNPGDKTEIDALLRTAERSTSPDEPTFGVITIDAGDFDALVKLARAVPTPKASDQDRVLAEARAVLEAGCREREEIARRSANHREPLKVDRDAAFADEVELATLTVPLPALKAVLGAFEPTLPASSNLASKREARSVLSPKLNDYRDPSSWIADGGIREPVGGWVDYDAWTALDPSPPQLLREEIEKALVGVFMAAWKVCDDTEGTPVLDEDGQECLMVPKDTWDRLSAALDVKDAAEDAR